MAEAPTARSVTAKRSTAGGQDFEVVEPNAAAMIESMRAVGYTPQAAVADLIDNSLSAAAKNVWLTLFWDGASSYIAIRDDGHGMSEEELTNAMRLGSRSPLEEREAGDLGRFGLGLKTASFSQCRRLTVCSKRSGEAASVRRWDLDYVNETEEWRLLKEAAPGSGRRLDGLALLGSGTVVLWEDMDRLVEQAPVDDERAQRRFLDLARAVEKHLAMVFHRFLEGRSELNVWINDVKIEPWDPFLSKEPATQRLAEEFLILDDTRVPVRPFVLPHHSKLLPEIHREAAGPSGWNAQQGFYIYRNRRLLVPGDWLRLGFQKEEHCKLARIQVDLPNSLDSEWNIDVKKSTARPPGPTRDDLRRIATITRQRASEIYRHRGKVIAREVSQEHAFVWNRLVKRGKIFYRVNREHPLVKQELEKLGPRRDDLEALLRMIEETVPAPLIALDVSEKPDEQSTPFESSAPSEVVAVLARVYRALRDGGLPDREARARLLGMEPFNHFPELVTSFEEVDQR
jgi:Histidine kinase-, DNA gyrase B-, and HSP90-like ATPase